jgi:hypothetical protein
MLWLLRGGAALSKTHKPILETPEKSIFNPHALREHETPSGAI